MKRNAEESRIWLTCRKQKILDPRLYKLLLEVNYYSMFNRLKIFKGNSILKGSITHYKSWGVLKRNCNVKFPVYDGDGKQWNCLNNSLLQCNVWLTNLQFFLKASLQTLLTNKKLKENQGYISPLLFLNWKVLSSKTFALLCQKPPAEEISIEI